MQARVTAWGQPSASVAVVLPGGPLYLLGHEPRLLKRATTEPSILPRTKNSGSRWAWYPGGKFRCNSLAPRLAA